MFSTIRGNWYSEASMHVTVRDFEVCMLSCECQVSKMPQDLVCQPFSSTPPGGNTMPVVDKHGSQVMHHNVVLPPPPLLPPGSTRFHQVPGVVNILRVLPAAGPDIWDPTLTTDLDGLGHTEAYVNYDDEN